jgi:type II secretory pathway component GspD/PulD (secretin)
MPILGKIPVLGYLFGGEGVVKTKSDVVVALTCERIERFAEGAAGITAEDDAIMKQGDGSTAIQEPVAGWGFDQLLFDKEK